MWYYSPFDSLEYRRDGLLLTSCGLGGSSKHFLPRSQVDHISFGRHHNVGLTLVGLSSLITGIMLMISDNNNYDYSGDGMDTAMAVGIALLSVGCLFVFLSLLLLTQQALIIATVNGTFVSRNCCQVDRVEELSNWVTTGIASDVYSPPVQHGHAYPSVAHGNAYGSVGLLQAQA